MKGNCTDFYRVGKGGLGFVVVKIDSQALKLSNDGPFTQSEIRYFGEKGNKPQTLTGIYAAKQAFSAALESAFDGTAIIVSCDQEVELLHEKSGKPYYKLSGITKMSFDREFPYSKAELSISHDGGYAAAICAIALAADKVNGDIRNLFGIDLIRAERLQKPTESFLKRVFSESEVALYRRSGDSSEILAGLFAAKEAFLKALGVGVFNGVKLNEVELSCDEDGGLCYKLGTSAQNALCGVGLYSAVRVFKACDGLIFAVCRLVLVEEKRFNCFKELFGSPNRELEPQERLCDLAEELCGSGLFTEISHRFCLRR